MYVADEGPRNGPVLLLLHGFASSHRAWDRVVPDLVADHRVVRPDLLGHGRTGGRAADAPAQAEAVARELDRLGLEDVVVVGHSFGADVAAELVTGPAAHRFVRVMIVAQAPDYSEATMPGVGRIMTHRRWSPLFWNLTVRQLLVPVRWLARRRAEPGNLAEFGVNALADLRRLDPAMFRVVLVDRPARLADDPLDRRLAGSGLPVSVLLGDADHFYGDRPAPRYRAIGAEVEIVPGGAHAMPILSPEVVVRAIRGLTAGRDVSALPTLPRD